MLRRRQEVNQDKLGMLSNEKMYKSSKITKEFKNTKAGGATGSLNMSQIILESSLLGAVLVNSAPRAEMSGARLCTPQARGGCTRVPGTPPDPQSPAQRPPSTRQNRGELAQRGRHRPHPPRLRPRPAPTRGSPGHAPSGDV